LSQNKITTDRSPCNVQNCLWLYRQLFLSKLPGV